MSKYAVIETGGKQYRVAEGDEIIIEKLNGVKAGDPIEFDKVLLISDNGSAKIGAPYVEGAKVLAQAREIFKGEKIIVYKYKRKTRYRRKRGHRQPYLKALIKEIKTGRS